MRSALLQVRVLSAPKKKKICSLIRHLRRQPFVTKRLLPSANILRQAIILDVILIVIVGIFFVASLLKPSLPMLPCEEDADVNEAPTNDVIVQSAPL